jgi:phosphoribosyl-ATP pyrophosphohydrolase/phosphoribosyl-AMP cyclohydrolase
MKLDFEKQNGLVPAIIQDDRTKTVLMLGFMNKAALETTMRTGKVTFYSRTRQTLWTKGETSGNFLVVRELLTDCDDDTILIKVRPTGPVCHTGKDTCFDEKNRPGMGFLNDLERIIVNRKEHPVEGSYTNTLFDAGMKKISQKVGEEATETIIEALTEDKERLKEEAADLMYHLLVLLQANDLSLADVEKVLAERHGGKNQK